jgi:hypothetical protein
MSLPATGSAGPWEQTLNRSERISTRPSDRPVWPYKAGGDTSRELMSTIHGRGGGRVVLKMSISIVVEGTNRPRAWGLVGRLAIITGPIGSKSQAAIRKHGALVPDPPESGRKGVVEGHRRAISHP